MFPIMCNAVTALHCDLLPFSIALILSVNSAFMTPIGTTLSLMVYGPGGYSANDFLRMGLPVKLFYLATAILIISLMYHL
jgi:di/tricarboxylate transporter